MEPIGSKDGESTADLPLGELEPSAVAHRRETSENAGLIAHRREAFETARVIPPRREAFETARVPPRRETFETARLPRRETFETARLPRRETSETARLPRREAFETARVIPRARWIHPRYRWIHPRYREGPRIRYLVASDKEFCGGAVAYYRWAIKMPRLTRPRLSLHCRIRLTLVSWPLDGGDRHQDCGA